MILVHMRHGFIFCGEQREGIGNRQQQIVRAQCCGFGKTAVEMSRRDVDDPEREIGKIRVERGVGVPPQKAVTQQRIGIAAGCAAQSQARMGERVALAALRQQQRAARIRIKLAGVRGKL